MEHVVDRFRTMDSFVRVVRLGSFTAAAKQLGISRALVSRYIADLEGRLGVRLLNRTTRHLTTTEMGATYFDFCQRALKEIDEQEFSLARLQTEPRGSLKVAAPKSFGSLNLGDAVIHFATQQPDIHVSLVLDDFSFRSYDFVENGLDVAIRLTELRDSSLIARKIATLKRVLCASSAYLALHGEPKRPADLTRHHCLAHVNLDPNEKIWRFQGPKGLIAVKIAGSFSSNSALVLRKAALAGVGVTCLPLYCVAGDLKSGALRKLLPDYPLPRRPIYVVYPPGSTVPEKIHCFVDFLNEWFKKPLCTHERSI